MSNPRGGFKDQSRWLSTSLSNASPHRRRDVRGVPNTPSPHGSRKGSTLSQRKTLTDRSLPKTHRRTHPPQGGEERDEEQPPFQPFQHLDSSDLDGEDDETAEGKKEEARPTQAMDQVNQQAAQERKEGEVGAAELNAKKGLRTPPADGDDQAGIRQVPPAVATEQPIDAKDAAEGALDLQNTEGAEGKGKAKSPAPSRKRGSSPPPPVNVEDGEVRINRFREVLAKNEELVHRAEQLTATNEKLRKEALETLNRLQALEKGKEEVRGKKMEEQSPSGNAYHDALEGLARRLASVEERTSISPIATGSRQVVPRQEMKPKSPPCSVKKASVVVPRKVEGRDEGDDSNKLHAEESGEEEEDGDEQRQRVETSRRKQTTLDAATRSKIRTIGERQRRDSVAARESESSEEEERDEEDAFGRLRGKKAVYRQRTPLHTIRRSRSLSTDKRARGESPISSGSDRETEGQERDKESNSSQDDEDEEYEEPAKKKWRGDEEVSAPENPRLLQLARDLTQEYMEEGERLIVHSFGNLLEEDRFFGLACRAMGIDKRGSLLDQPLTENDRKELRHMQGLLVEIPDRKREQVVNAMAERVFGVSLKNVPLMLHQKLTLVALLKRWVIIDVKVLKKFIAEYNAEDRLKVPGSKWAAKDVKNLKGEALASMKAEDMLSVPAMWHEFLQMAKDPLAARRSLMDAIRKKWRDPVHRKRTKSDAIRMMVFEIDEHLLTIEALITPHTEMDRMDAVKTLHEAIVLRLVERLEFCRVWTEAGPAAGAAFFRAVRKDPPDPEKDMAKMEEDVMKEVKSAQRKNVLGGVLKSTFYAPEQKKRERETIFQRTVAPAGRFPPAPRKFASSAPPAATQHFFSPSREMQKQGFQRPRPLDPGNGRRMPR